ncbi:MAG: hypothetical protein M3014_13820 [Chloroflexota bacterium]|nr:hypothetical protein [Chloroflexota bacterium]
MEKGFTQIGFQRRPGGGSGCGCCGLWLAGLVLLPVMSIAAFLLAL